MDLGFTLYFLIVFVFGGLLLLVVALYFIRDLFIREDRPSWSVRPPGSKAVFIFFLFLGAGLTAIPLRMLWVTRLAAVPGSYKSDGVWGTATLELFKDGRFKETWQFKNEYTGEPEGIGSMEGRWQDSKRDWLTRDIVFEPFKPLAQYDRGRISSTHPATVMGYGGVTLIEVDAGADIAFAR